MKEDNQTKWGDFLNPEVLKPDFDSCHPHKNTKKPMVTGLCGIMWTRVV